MASSTHHRSQTASRGPTIAEVPERLELVQAMLKEEHRQLFKLVEQIETHRQWADLAPLLRSLHELLASHFAREQFPGGLYDCLGAHRLADRKTVPTLIEQHCEILRLAKDLVERAQACNDRGWRGLLPHIDHLCHYIREHERLEHQLVDTLVHRPNVPEPAS